MNLSSASNGTTRTGMRALNFSTHTRLAAATRTNDGRKRMHVHRAIPVVETAVVAEGGGSGSRCVPPIGSTGRHRDCSRALSSIVQSVVMMMMLTTVFSSRLVFVRSWVTSSHSVGPAARFLLSNSFSALSSSRFRVRLLTGQARDEDMSKDRPRLSLISFDLDDTLFSTSDVIHAANNVLFDAMISCGCSSDVCTSDSFREATRRVRRSIDETGIPVTYRDLRKAAIRESFLSTNLRKTEDAVSLDMMVEQCYAAWLTERHAAAEQFLFPHAIATLKELRATHPEAKIAAITNGAGDPLEMPLLAPYFDFRISGEDDDIFPHRKPHPFIYESALRNVADDGLWIHIGDCLSNDVGASADVGAKAIWMCLEDDEKSAAERLVDTARAPTYSSASQEELNIRAQKVQEGRSRITASIRCLSELPTIILGVVQQSVKTSTGHTSK